MADVTIIDYGLGNLLSVYSAFEHLGATVEISSKPHRIKCATRVVLPGVGAFSSGMNGIRQCGFENILREIALKNTPLLGICLGMQLLFEESEEFGTTKGIGLIPGRIIPVPSLGPSGEILKIPHIGWNSLVPSLEIDDWTNTHLHHINSGEEVYFVHSFMANPKIPKHRLADSLYCGVRICAAIHSRNIFGCQFHPEKSGKVGLRILRQFLSANLCITG